MKPTTKLLLLIAIALGLLSSIGCTPVAAQYHIRVQCYYNPDAGHNPDYQSYSIEYTNDNWTTKNTLKETWDRSDQIWGNSVIYQEKLFQSGIREAEYFARNFKSYALCEKYNVNVLNKYHKLLAYRKAHPIIVVTVKAKKYDCCKPHNIY